MISTRYPLVQSKGHLTFADGSQIPTHRASCECGETFFSLEAKDVKMMWWEHVRWEHPEVERPLRLAPSEVGP